MEKIRAHGLSKELKLQSKQLTEVLVKYGIVKSHMRTLDERDLDIIFEYFTQANQVENFDMIFEKQQNEPKPVKEKAVNTNTAEEVGRKLRHVDTRANVIELDKIADEKIEQLVGEDLSSQGGIKKEKIKKGRHRQDKQITIDNKQHAIAEKKKKERFDVLIPDEITVGELAERLSKTPAEIVKSLMVLGMMATVNQIIDFDTASLIAEDFGGNVKREVIITEEDRLFNDVEDDEENLKPRSPVVVVMGHVDHGKTSLLDSIRNANVIDTEFGGITQHIGAHRVTIHDKKITFLDTPGHAAFTAMRVRGALVTDIAVLVVAADDGVMPQTIEAINHAKAANINIIVAINKIDKEGANPDRIKQELMEHELVAEEWGGDTIFVEVSAKKKINIDKLLEMIILVAEMKELRANPDRPAKGTVIESRLDKAKGPVADVLVQNGTLKEGDIIVAGTSVGRVRAMTNDRGKRITQAGPSMPVEIYGLSETPEGGDVFYVVHDERRARAVVEARKFKMKQEAQNKQHKLSLENLHEFIEAGKVKTLNIIIKADVQGSVEAVKQSLSKIRNEEVRVQIIHGGVGAVNESDIMLASASGAIIVGFNVRSAVGAMDSAERAEIDVRFYRVIYEAIEDIEAALKGMLTPKFREVVLGHAEIRTIFKASGVGTIGGSYVTDGKIQRGSSIRILRDGIVIHEGELASLKRFKDDVKEVVHGFECGLSIERFNDIKEQDIIEAYTMEEYRE